MTTGVELATKHCPTCGEDLPVSMFSRSRSRRDGLYYECKACSRVRARVRLERRRAEVGEEAFRAERAAAVRRHRATPAGREAARLQAKAYKHAESQLREAHRAEFDALYRIARYELGLPIEDDS